MPEKRKSVTMFRYCSLSDEQDLIAEVALNMGECDMACYLPHPCTSPSLPLLSLAHPSPSPKCPVSTVVLSR